MTPVGVRVRDLVITAERVLRALPGADDETIREYLAGNLCRCGSYYNILGAVRACNR